MATEISTWEELLATQAGQEYSWVGGSLNFDDIQPTGFTAPITINGSVDFNGAVFFNFRSMSSIALKTSVNANVYKQYLKNLTFQNIEHIPTNLTYGMLFDGNCDVFENIVFTGVAQGTERTGRYSLLKVSYGSGARQRIDRFGCDLTIKLNCPFFLTNTSATGNPASNNRIPIYDGRIKIDLEYNGTLQPIPHDLYNCKIAGRIKNNNESAADLELNPYYCAISLESNKPIICPNTNLVRSDLAEYTGSRLVRCEAPFYEYKEAIADSGFPYNGAERDGGD